ncbi:NADP-dependent oxidoreductase [Amycolatopsis sp. MtRt-6]|uniref:NADP-dependent oxidoreductase n=1 Tax=Amycolatopsis sp. MtRt-6 TaxID=2792782 RepID=UPI001A8C3DB2|nr:NADP-dependent oxidoreductase [Amycolatopsis sp. MtRt-6]
MRAMVIRRFGGPEVLEFAEVPVPEPGPGQVRIRVAAAAVNPVDLATRSGALTAAGVIPPRAVLGLGWDVAGEIDAIGGDAGLAAGPGEARGSRPGPPGERAPFQVGDAVIGLRDRIASPLGAYAGYIVLDSAAVAPAPTGASPAEAATLPLNSLTAAQALDLVETTGTVLVTGAAGAVGGYAVALAHARKLRVVAVAAEADEAQVRAFGADEFVPRGPALADRVRAVVPGGVDAALDTALLGLDALDAVRGGGEFVAFAAGAAPIPLRGIRVRGVWIRADGERLAELARLAENGTLPLRVAGVRPLAEAAIAHERLAAGGLRGRLVLTP